MARCEQGYRCDVCGHDVENITESDLYLHYVLGEVDPETLHLQTERHIRCNPVVAQFIVDEEFPIVAVEGLFAKSGLDPDWVAEEEVRVTAAYRRLHEIFHTSRDLPISEYPQAEAASRWRDPGQ
jgi:hypothetical protein